MKSSTSLIRPLVRSLHGYVPGEQPKVRGLIKLNTNENPYPPSPKVLAAVKKATDERLRLYPNPKAQKLREKLAVFHGCSPENIIIGNGSDELLALATRAFVEPLSSNGTQEAKAGRPSCETVQFFTPSYSLYPVLAAIHGAKANPVPLRPDFSMPSVPELKRGRIWDFKAALTCVTTPNAPSGRGYGIEELDTLCAAQQGTVVLDEAYVDFARENALELALKYPHVLVSRTFSKAYSLCFLRVGYFVGPAALIEALDKIRDSYNVNGLAQAAAEATLDALPYYQANFRKVLATREKLSHDLCDLGFRVLPSQANFILVEPPVLPAKMWLEKLRERKILVRWFPYPETERFIRITIGSEAESKALLRTVQQILAQAAA